MLRIRSFHALWLDFPEHSPHISSSDIAVLQPHTCRNTYGLGSSPFARHYWGNHCYFLFLRVLRCFSSPRSPLTLSDSRPSTCWVVPFGNLRINGHLHLHGAYRSLSRPSSPPRAKASAMCPFLLSFLSTHCNFHCGAGDIYFQLVLKNITFCFVQYVIDRLLIYDS